MKISEAPEFDENEIRGELQTAMDKEFKKYSRPTILVCGYTGTGKTSLIKAICGPDVVSDDAISHGRPGTKDYTNYATRLVSFWDSQGFEPGGSEQEFVDRTRGFVRQRQTDEEVKNHIHLVWYAIQGPGARVTDCDVQLIKEVFAAHNEIVIMTKNDITREEQRNAMTRRLIECGVAPKRILPVAEKDHESHMDLMKLTLELLPEAYKGAFERAQIVDLDAKKARAHAIIHSASASAAAAGGLNPIPVSDALVIMPIQITMISGLAVLYGMPKEAIKAAAMPVALRTVGTLTTSSLLKLFPGLGHVVNAAVAAALTEAFGWSVQRYLHACLVARIENKPMPEFVADFGEMEKMAIKLKK